MPCSNCTTFGFIIVSKDKPHTYMDIDGYLSNDVSQAFVFKTADNAITERDAMDEPEKYSVKAYKAEISIYDIHDR